MPGGQHAETIPIAIDRSGPYFHYLFDLSGIPMASDRASPTNGDRLLLAGFLRRLELILDFTVLHQSELIHRGSELPQVDAWGTELRNAWGFERARLVEMIGLVENGGQNQEQIDVQLVRRGLTGATLRFKLESIDLGAARPISLRWKKGFNSLTEIVGIRPFSEFSGDLNAQPVGSSGPDHSHELRQKSRTWWGRFAKRLAWVYELIDEVLNSLVAAIGLGGALEEFKGILEKLLAGEPHAHHRAAPATVLILAFALGLVSEALSTGLLR